ncbi:hypothetical protein ODU73_001778 [Thermoclostridium stercorarium]|uniref:hypothetical protein n=1 Tax=Thermoclostridium stercorarium TaxID=1510 RepID=UPI0004B0FBBA|nr:hypothetical protein [Thermoclostridium stercorarium]UZQ84725.1 hypothetical protein ODU73_001778 [Thermoclostridium stercorarium]
MEVPSGIIADKWGRKKLIIVSAFLGCCEFLILIYAREFIHFALAVFLAGVGSAAGSGAENALFMIRFSQIVPKILLKNAWDF